MPLTLRRTILAASLACVALVTAELAARADDWIRLGIPFTHTPQYEQDLRFQDWFGMRGRPNGRYRRWRLDNYGFRGPDIAMTPTNGCTRIVVLGASETFGLYESDGKEYVAQLRDSLRSRGCYEVVNAAIAGAGLKAIIRLWDNYVAQFLPAIVVVYPSPTFYLGVKAPGWSPTGKPEQPHDLPFRPRLLEQVKNVWQTPEFLQRRRLNSWIADATAGQPEDWYFRSTPEDRLDMFMSDLDSLVKSIRDHGAVPVVMTHAMRFSIPPDPSDEFIMLDWRNGAPRATTNALLGTEHEAAERVRTYAERERVCLVDVDRRLTGHPEYFADAAHFTDAGAGAMAQLIAQRLTERTPDCIGHG